MPARAPSSADPIVREALSRLKIAEDADVGDRAAAQEDLQFAAGDQWPQMISAARKLDNRPCLTINKVDTYVRNIVNSMRQQRPRIKIHAVSDGADEAEARVIEGLIRHIEVSSNADQAYDNAMDFQVRMGWGYWRVAARYVDEKSFDQELYIDRVRNPFSVYMDPSSVAPDGSDMAWCIITDKMRREEFKRLYPSAKEADFIPAGTGDPRADWSTKEEVGIAEYWRVEEVAEDLFQLSSGENVFKSDAQGAKKVGDMVGQAMVIDSRKSMRRTVKWAKISRSEVLEEREWPGRYIPVFPCYGAESVVDGKIVRFGAVRNAKDPQRMVNFWRSSECELVALAPKAPWVGYEGFAEGHESEWRTANIKNHSYLEQKAVYGDDGQLLPPVVRQPPQQIPQASVQAALGASEDLKAVFGMFDPSLGEEGNETSGVMVRNRQNQADITNFHFYDNATRVIRWTGIVLLDLIPHYYNRERTLRIIGEDGTPESITINKKAVDKVLHDMTVGRYDVVMDTGPGYDTKRMENADRMLELLKVMGPEIAPKISDLIVRQMDFPANDKIADRLAMANPLAQIDKQVPDGLDPNAREMIGNLMAQLQQAKQAVQQLTMEKQAHVFGAQAKVQAEMQRDVQEHALGMERLHAEEGHATHQLHIKELGADERERMKIAASLQETAMKDRTSLQETLIDARTNLEIAHRQAQSRGQPNTNKPTK